MSLDDLSMVQTETFRIPVSLKFDTDDMFYGLIKPARDNKTLTTLIINLLRAYYEDEEIQRLVDARVAGDNILRELNEDLERISLEHSKSMAQVSALKYETANATSSFFSRQREAAPMQQQQPTRPSQPSQPLLGNDEVVKGIMNVLAQLTEKVENLEGKQNKKESSSTNLTEEIQKVQDNITSQYAAYPDMPDFDAQLYGAISDNNFENVQDSSIPDEFKDDTNYTSLGQMGNDFEPTSVMEMLQDKPLQEVNEPVQEEPKPVVKEEPKLVVHEEPKPVVHEEPKPAVPEEHKPVVPTEPVPVNDMPSVKKETTAVEIEDPVFDSVFEDDTSANNLSDFAADDDDPVFEDAEVVEEPTNDKPKLPASFLKLSSSLTRTANK